MKRIVCLLIFSGLVVAACTRFVFADLLVVQDIRIEGLQRVSVGVFFQSFPINIGDSVESDDIVEATRKLFKTGLFNDIEIIRDVDVIVVIVEERPSISTINVEGNKEISSKDLLTGLKQSGLNEGDIFQRTTLDKLEQELIRQYISQGRYGVTVETEVTELERNRVDLTIKIYEGKSSTIKRINIVGNSIYTNEELLNDFSLKSTNWRSFYRNDDKYSREKLVGDLERLRSKYLNNGYVNFNIESTQVSITPDKAYVFITINVVEGFQYIIGDVSFSGDLTIPEQKFKSLLKVHRGDVFSNQHLVETKEAMINQLGDEGYSFAKVNAIPETDESKKLVNINLYIEPGKIVYVRRISFTGNAKTNENVLRREMRQMESVWASNKDIELSRLRLQQLGFFKGVNVEIQPVPGADDLIDINYEVEEQPSGSVSLSLGFSGDSGLTLGIDLDQKNFLGTGNNVAIKVAESTSRTNYSFSYLDPYYTVDGVSRGFDVFFRELNFDKDDISNFSTNSLGGNVSFGYPLSETEFLSFEVGYEYTGINTGSFPALELTRFLDDEGDNYNNFLVFGRWRESTLNRGIFANRGAFQSLSLEFSLPGSDLNFYKMKYKGKLFIPLVTPFTLRLRANLGYGNGYGSTNRLPFYENFFSGGSDSVRGFKNNALGPRGTPASGERGNENDLDIFGGNILVTGSAELLFPAPFIKDKRTIETGFFFDSGNVFDSDCGSNRNFCSGFHLDELRYSVGFAATWLSSFGPLSFSLARTLNDKSFEDTEFFQFSFGNSF